MNKASWKNVIIAIVGLLGTGFLTNILGFWQFNIQREDTYIEKYNQELKANGVLLVENNQLKNALTLLSISDLELPFPAWVKGSDGKMLFINDRYESEILSPFGIDKMEYIGHDMESFLNDSIVKSYDETDLQVIKSGMVVRVIDVIPKPGGETQKGIVYKFPVIFNGKVEFVGGTWIELLDEDCN